jgi:2-amino-4-hydroxy-6-hydroxymethyldihydropteridine diphosphokinase
MNKAYLLTGSNMGNRVDYLNQAVDLINAEAGKILTHSALYETAAWGKTDQPPFLNQALLLQTSLEAWELMTLLLRLEEKMGRKRLEKYGARIIDIDILLFNNVILKTPELTIPHPELQNRQFALKPLAEIAGGLQHPILHKTIDELLLACTDPLSAIKFENTL